MQITSAMKMVSAAKLKRAQDAITQMRPYANKLRDLLVNLSSTLEVSDGGAFSQERETQKVLLVTITSNRGLCGAFNSNIIKKAISLAENDYANADVSFLTIGKKGSEFFAKNSFTVRSVHDSLYDELTFENTSAIAEDIMQNFL